MLQHLYEFQQDQYLPDFITNLSSTISKEICKELKQSAQATMKISKILTLIPDRTDEEEIKNEIASTPSKNSVFAAKNGFILLLQLFKKNKEQLLPLKEFMSRRQIIRDGNMADGLLTIHAAENDTLQEFIEQFILRKIIYRHQMVALRKMGNGSQATYKFFIEEQYIRFIDTFPPRNTSPRMNALRNIMFDLQVINEKSILTPVYKQLLIN